MKKTVIDSIHEHDAFYSDSKRFVGKEVFGHNLDGAGSPGDGYLSGYVKLFMEGEVEETYFHGVKLKEIDIQEKKMTKSDIKMLDRIEEQQSALEEELSEMGNRLVSSCYLDIEIIIENAKLLETDEITWDEIVRHAFKQTYGGMFA